MLCLRPPPEEAAFALALETLGAGTSATSPGSCVPTGPPGQAIAEVLREGNDMGEASIKKLTNLG